MPEPETEQSEIKPEDKQKVAKEDSNSFYHADESSTATSVSTTPDTPQAGGGSDVREDVVREHLRSVVDPELGISIIELGLVYGIDIQEDGKVNVRMTLTSPACPLGAVIQAQVHTALSKLPWVKEPSVQLVWSPRWDPYQMATEDARMQLGIL